MKIRKANPFPFTKERIKKRPPIHAYKSHLAKNFIGSTGKKFYDCSIYTEDGHPNEQAKPKKINWKFRFTNNKRPNFVWVPKNI